VRSYLFTTVRGALVYRLVYSVYATSCARRRN
jgi:hypothetical protein